MNRNKELLKNTIIIFTGKLCTQLITFVLLPIYTNYLTKTEYGTVDLVITYINLFSPLLSLQLEYAAFRFLIDKRKDCKGQNLIISNVMHCLFIIILFTSVIFIIINGIFNIKYGCLLILILVFTMLSNMMLQFSRGLGNNLIYSIGSFLAGSLNAIISILCIVFLKTDISGIYLAMIISNFVCFIYIFLKMKIYAKIKYNLFDKKIVKKLLNYSLPMIPNSICWWIISVSDRTLISTFLGLSYNGIYSVSSKFSGLIVTVYNMFNLSWTEEISLHIKDSDSNQYISKTFDDIIKIFACGCVLLIAFIPLVFNILVGNEYRSSYIYIPFLVIGSFFNIIMGMLSAIYIGLKKSKEMAKSSALAALINIIINTIFIKKIGIWAAVLSTVISYMVVSIYRIFDVKKYINLKLNKITFFHLFLIFSTTIIVYIYDDKLLNILNLIIVLVFSLLYNKKVLVFIYKSIKEKIKHIRTA